MHYQHNTVDNKDLDTAGATFGILVYLGSYLRVQKMQRPVIYVPSSVRSYTVKGFLLGVRS